MRAAMRRSLGPAFVAATLAAAASLLAAGTASAQFDAGSTASSLAPEDFFIRMQDIPGHTLSDFDVARYFNKARCDCTTPATIYVALSQSGLAKLSTLSNQGSLEVWIGSTCNDINLRGTRCRQLNSTLMSVFLRMDAARLFIPTDVRMMSSQPNLGVDTTFDGGISGNGEFPNPDCTINGQQFTQSVWALVDSDNNGSPDVAAMQSVLIDLTPPPPPDPATVSVVGGNQALIINWHGVDTGLYPDLIGYQILCNRGGDLQVFSDGTFRPGFLSCETPDAGVGTIDPTFDGGVQSLNPLFACSPLLSATTSSYRLKILQNDITYGAAVVSIDNSGNASTPDLFYGVPIKTKSFYDVYRNDDPDHPGTANGGLCTLGIGSTSGGAGAIGGACGALALIAIVLARRGRRGRRP
jgi:hypothetical protein